MKLQSVNWFQKRPNFNFKSCLHGLKIGKRSVQVAMIISGPNIHGFDEKTGEKLQIMCEKMQH